MYDSTQKFLGKLDWAMREELYAYHLEFMGKISKKLQGRDDFFQNCVVQVELATDLKTRAGEACFKDNLIRINYEMHKNNPQELRNTYGHELCHILARLLYGWRIKGHGKEWKALSRAIGVRPETRYHDDTFLFE